jgi:DNA-binding LacI/PurR family transcriptional regulator
MSTKKTLKDVAQHAGVSYQTVSKVLRNQMRVTPEVRDRIFSAVGELGYRPNVTARNLRLQSSRHIGYSWEPWRQNFFNPVLEQFQQGIVEAAELLGYHILLFPQRPGGDLAETYRDLVRTGRVDGFVLSSLEYHDPRIRALQQLNVPLVAFGRTQSERPFAYVDVDGEAGLYAAMTHLFAQGHRRVAALAWPEHSRVGQERLSGYLKAMEDAGLPVDPAWIARGTGDFEFGYSATPSLLDLPSHRRPTAIVTMLDLMALGAMRALEECGLRVGQDVAVVGFDDMPVIQYLKPGLTSVRQPVWEVAQKVVEMLVSLLEGKPADQQQVLLMPELIVRESTSVR